MTIVREPVHNVVHRPLGNPRRRYPAHQPRYAHTDHRPPHDEPAVDVYLPRRNVRVDQTFWQHRSIFAGSQEQLNQLRREADHRAAARARAAWADHVQRQRADEERSVLRAHRPAFRQFKAIIHVRLFPMLWNITTCRCGDRWPCNSIKLYIRHRWGWNSDFDQRLAELSRHLPKPASRWTRLRRFLTRRPTRAHDDSVSALGA